MTEVVYASISAVPSRIAGSVPSEARTASLRWLRERPSPPAEPPTGSRFLGVDIVTPVPSYHSALVEPGLIRHGRALTDILNENGLVAADGDELREMMEEANESGYLLSTFCAVAIYLCETPNES
jgi:hypothetical protein